MAATFKLLAAGGRGGLRSAPPYGHGDVPFGYRRGYVAPRYHAH